MKLGKMNAMSPDGKMSKLQFIKWLLTCGLVPYENFEDRDDSKEFQDEADIMTGETVDADALSGMLEVSLSDTSNDRALPEVSGLPSPHEGKQSELFSLITLKKERKSRI